MYNALFDPIEWWAQHHWWSNGASESMNHFKLWNIMQVNPWVKVPSFTRSDTRRLCLSLSVVNYLHKLWGPRGAHWGSNNAFVVLCSMLIQKVAKQSVFASVWLHERERCSERCQNVLLSPSPCLSLKISLWTRNKPMCVRVCLDMCVCSTL